MLSVRWQYVIRRGTCRRHNAGRLHDLTLLGITRDFIATSDYTDRNHWHGLPISQGAEHWFVLGNVAEFRGRDNRGSGQSLGRRCFL